MREKLYKPPWHLRLRSSGTLEAQSPADQCFFNYLFSYFSFLFFFWQAHGSRTFWILVFFPSLKMLVGVAALWHVCLKKHLYFPGNHKGCWRPCLLSAPWTETKQSPQGVTDPKQSLTTLLLRCLSKQTPKLTKSQRIWGSKSKKRVRNKVDCWLFTNSVGTTLTLSQTTVEFWSASMPQKLF